MKLNALKAHLLLERESERLMDLLRDLDLDLDRVRDLLSLDLERDLERLLVYDLCVNAYSNTSLLKTNTEFELLIKYILFLT